MQQITKLIQNPKRTVLDLMNFYKDTLVIEFGLLNVGSNCMYLHYNHRDVLPTVIFDLKFQNSSNNCFLVLEKLLKDLPPKNDELRNYQFYAVNYQPTIQANMQPGQTKTFLSLEEICLFDPFAITLVS